MVDFLKKILDEYMKELLEKCLKELQKEPLTELLNKSLIIVLKNAPKDFLEDPLKKHELIPCGTPDETLGEITEVTPKKTLREFPFIQSKTSSRNSRCFWRTAPLRGRASATFINLMLATFCFAWGSLTTPEKQRRRGASPIFWHTNSSCFDM